MYLNTAELRSENEKLNHIITNMKQEKQKSFNYLNTDQINNNFLLEKMDTEVKLNNKISLLKIQLLEKDKQIHKLENQISELSITNAKLVKIVKKYREKFTLDFSRSMDNFNQTIESNLHTMKNNDSLLSAKSYKNLHLMFAENGKHSFSKSLKKKQSVIERETLINKIFEQMMKTKSLKELLTLSVKLD